MPSKLSAQHQKAPSQGLTRRLLMPGAEHRLTNPAHPAYSPSLPPTMNAAGKIPESSQERACLHGLLM